ncbi:hypothetical protein DIPPA_18625 [Diplonema papillatum]|nr:hypothetical protein DIPPA_18625 [Diplonema papillatum]
MNFNFLDDLVWYHYAAAGALVLLLVLIVGFLVKRRRNTEGEITWDDIAALDRAENAHQPAPHPVNLRDGQCMQPPLPILEHTI